MFTVPGPRSRDLKVMCSVGTPDIPWEHVSVSLVGRPHTPAWDEMCLVKSLFWGPEEVVIQIHPPESQYVNDHPGCLHLWRPKFCEIPLPPPRTVGTPRMEKPSRRISPVMTMIAASVLGNGDDFDREK
jgi:hypothetical protein